MTEREKMLAGGWFDPRDAELTAIRDNATRLMHRLNVELCGHDDAYRAALRELCPGCEGFIREPFRCDYGLNISIGEGSFVNFDCVFLDLAPIRIGRHTLIGPKVQLLTALHPFDATQRRTGLEAGRPIAVGYDGPRGVVATASYEARPYGVHSALSSVLAKRLCPELIFVPARFDVYKAVSRQIRAIFGEYTELVEPLSLDEAFLDVSHVRSATLVAREIKARILAETGLTASAGISVNKMLAKIASDYRKPDGLFTIPPERIEEFVAGLPVERFFGIGEVTAEKMHRLGIRTGADLRLWNEAALVQQFGKAGHSYYGYARGIDEREVTPNRVRKSLGAETTFAEDTDDRERLRLELSAVREEVWNRVMRHEFRGKTVVLKLKFDNFRQITRSKTLFTPVDSAETLRRVSEELLAAADFHGRKIRLIGLTVGNSPEACPECVQLRFDFGNPET